MLIFYETKTLVFPFTYFQSIQRLRMNTYESILVTMKYNIEITALDHEDVYSEWDRKLPKVELAYCTC